MYSFPERFFVPAVVSALLIVGFGCFFWQAGLPLEYIRKSASQSFFWVVVVCVTFLLPTRHAFNLSKSLFCSAVVVFCWTSAADRLHERYSWIVSPITYAPREEFKYPVVSESITVLLANPYLQATLIALLLGLSLYAWRVEHRRF